VGHDSSLPANGQRGAYDFVIPPSMIHRYQ
jgi:hypothetical protein